MNFEDEKDHHDLSPPTSPLNQLNPKEFLIALSPQKPIIIKKNAKTFLHDFHESAQKLLDNMKEKYISELQERIFDENKGETSFDRVKAFAKVIAEAERLINGKIDFKLGIEIIHISLNWVHPHYFNGQDLKSSEIFDECLKLSKKAFGLLTLAYFKLKDYEKSIYYAKISLYFEPNSVFTLRLMYSAWSHLGDTEEARKIMAYSKKILSIAELHTIKKGKKNNKRNLFCKFLKKHSKTLIFSFITGVTTFVSLKFFWKYQVKESLYYSFSTALIFMMSSIFINKK